MARTFAYCRVSTSGQTTENQLREIDAAGFRIEPRRVVSETISGSSAIEQRPGFMKLMDRLKRDDVLIVTKLDRLGRNAIDVATLGRRATLDAEQREAVRKALRGGASVSEPARQYETSRQTIMRARDAATA